MPKRTDERRFYAMALTVGVRAAWLTLLAGLALYYLGLLPGRAPMAKWPELWGLSAAELEGRLGPSAVLDGESLILWGVILLAITPLAGYLSLVPLFCRRREWLYCLVAGLQIILLAAPLLMG